MTGAITAAAMVISSSARSETVALITFEGSFLVDKMLWSISNRLPNTFVQSGSTLTMNGKALNTTGTEVSDFVDTRLSDGAEHISFTLAATTSDGHCLDRVFETTVYAQ
jgi:hypothetical protein